MRVEAKRLLATTQGRVSFEEAYEAFKKTHVATKKPSTQRGYKHILERHHLPVLKNKRMTSITSHMLSAIAGMLHRRYEVNFNARKRHPDRYVLEPRRISCIRQPRIPNAPAI
jgi:hypothetical protein